MRTMRAMRWIKLSSFRVLFSPKRFKLSLFDADIECTGKVNLSSSRYLKQAC